MSESSSAPVDISVVLPVYNQADHIGSVVQEYEDALARIPKTHETLLIVNDSRDRSLEVCKNLEQKYPSVRALYSEQGGWGRAVRAGLSQAKGSVICYTNSARTSAQDLAMLLLYATVYPNIVVKANRKIRDNWRRRLGSLIYNLQCRAMFNLSNWDINGTPKVFPRSFTKLLNLSETGDLIDVEFIVTCQKENYPVIEVPVLSARRHGGNSTTNYFSAARLYWGAFQFWKQRKKQ